MLANRRPSRCQAPGAKQLAPLSTAWQRMATGKETKEGPNRCQAPSEVVYGISGRCSAARPPCLRPPSPLYLMSASGDLGIPDWDLRATRKPRE